MNGLRRHGLLWAAGTIGAPRLHTPRVAAGLRRLSVMSSDSPHDAVDAAAGVDPAAAPIPPALEPAAYDAYRAAARWTGIRLRQAVHDGAVVVAAYHNGYLDGLGAAAEGLERVPNGETAGADAPDSADGGEDTAVTNDRATVAPSVDALVERARVEGYADGLRWREPGRRGGLVRLMLFLTGKSARRFATEDLMRSPRRVRRMIAYSDVVEDVVRDELLRRLHGTRAAT